MTFHEVEWQKQVWGLQRHVYTKHQIVHLFLSTTAADKNRGYVKNVSQEPHTLHANEEKLIRDLSYRRAILGRKTKTKQ